MSELPRDLLYTPTHEWVRVDAVWAATVGITDFAQHALGDIVFISFPRVGDQVVVGEPCALVETEKAAVDVCAPVSGTIKAINGPLSSNLAQLNQQPYTAWLVQIQMQTAGVDGLGLLDSTAYERLLLGRANRQTR